jgi:hypothetical protein
MAAARCPMCHQANERTAWQCRRCGYEFGQTIETLRGMLLAQLGRAKITFAIMLVLELVLASGTVYAISRGFVLLPWLPFLLVTWGTVRAWQKIAISRESLASIERQQAQLPKASVRSRESS